MIILSLLDQLFRYRAKNDWNQNPFTIGPLKIGYVENHGAFHGIMKKHPKRVLLLQTVFVICSFFYAFYLVLTGKNSLLQLGWLLASLGGINNLWDRALHGYVTDYVSLNGKLYFNIADLFVFTGATIIFLSEIIALAKKS